MSWLVRAAYRTLRSTTSAYSRHAGSQLAAAIAYRVLFSLVPFVALLISILDVVLPPRARDQFADWLFASFPGTEVESSVDRALGESGAAAPLVGVLALATLLWSASGMIASIRPTRLESLELACRVHHVRVGEVQASDVRGGVRVLRALGERSSSFRSLLAEDVDVERIDRVQGEQRRAPAELPALPVPIHAGRSEQVDADASAGPLELRDARELLEHARPVEELLVAVRFRLVEHPPIGERWGKLTGTAG